MQTTENSLTKKLSGTERQVIVPGWSVFKQFGSS